MDDIHPLQAWLDKRKDRIKPAAFAKLVGIKQSHLALICSRRRGPSARVALAIELATNRGVTVKQLVANPPARRGKDVSASAAARAG